MERRGRNSIRIFDLGVLMLVNELLNIGYDAIPRVTFFTIVGQTFIYAQVLSVPWTKMEACISGDKVLHNGDFKTLILSALEHGDDMHLYFNMVSFLIKGRTLENMYGSGNFAILLSLLTLMTSSIYVLLASLTATLFREPAIMSSCAIGFSGVIFALKFITSTEQPQGYSTIQGIEIPMRYTAWAELIAIHLLVPNASFMGHLAGILAGFIYMKTPLRRFIDSLLEFVTGYPMLHTDEDEESDGSSNI